MEDEKIVSLFWQRDEAAIRETSSKYGKLCHSIAFGVLRSKEDAEECVNDTYTRVWNSIPPDQPEHLDAYVSKVTRRIAIDRYRKNTADKRSASTVPIIDELSEALPDGADAAVDKITIRDTVNRFVISLSPLNRIIFMRRYFYCASVREIASLLRMTETGVNMRLGRMRKKLKEALASSGVEV